MEIRRLDKKDISRLKLLLKDYRYNQYRNYRIADKKDLENSILQEILGLVEDGGELFAAELNLEIVGIICGSKLAWDSNYFGLKMAKIDFLITGKCCLEQAFIKDELILFLFKYYKSKKIQHVSFRIDTFDHLTINCLERNGFQLMDTLVTYILVDKRCRIPDLKCLYKVRNYQKKDLPFIMEIAEKNPWISRFSLDPFIPKDKANKFFKEWIKNCCSDISEDIVLVAEKGGKVKGFFTYRTNEHVYNVFGLRGVGRGISVVLPDAKGAFVSFLKSAIGKGKEEGQINLAEFDTQIWNYQSVKIFQRFGMEYVKSVVTFHKILCE